MKVPGKSYSAENLYESLMLVKRLIFCKHWGGLRWKQIFKVAYKKHLGLLKKKQKSDIACWDWENLILKRKKILLKNLTMPKTV